MVRRRLAFSSWSLRISSCYPAIKTNSHYLSTHLAHERLQLALGLRVLPKRSLLVEQLLLFLPELALDVAVGLELVPGSVEVLERQGFPGDTGRELRLERDHGLLEFL